MPKLILVCGKICSGKTTYTKKLIKEIKAVHLSVDEISMSIYGGQVGSTHAQVVEKIIHYLFNKSIEIYNTGFNVVIDTGFWQKADRNEANEFYKNHNIIPEWHYIDVPDEMWQKGIRKRNNDIKIGRTVDCVIDDNTMKMFLSFWETPNKDEIDVWIINDWC
ncbi:hypothetical protein SDC9_108573 [bioreactor metagenome]|uniref:ATP-binding protein n=1 Tax=bioreactor metagenome TaxID=1076179 RepID=A0A645BEW0_9ZZZZ|nr:ATP-binding protein [Oscillospiraceae bacterium]